MQPTSSLLGTRRHSSTRLPRLPVPKLHQTLQRYLTSLEPFLQEDELNDGASFETSLALRRKWAEDFENGLGIVCQNRLHGGFVVTLWSSQS
jgi:hypothetical protein